MRYKGIAKRVIWKGDGGQVYRVGDRRKLWIRYRRYEAISSLRKINCRIKRDINYRRKNI